MILTSFYLTPKEWLCSGWFIPLLPLGWHVETSSTRLFYLLAALPSQGCSSEITPRRSFAFCPIRAPTFAPTPAMAVASPPLHACLFQPCDRRISPSSTPSSGTSQSQHVAASTGGHWGHRVAASWSHRFSVFTAAPGVGRMPPEMAPQSPPSGQVKELAFSEADSWNETCRQNLTSCLGI